MSSMRSLRSKLDGWLDSMSSMYGVVMVKMKRKKN